MELTRFLIEQAHAAANLFWVRTNVFLAIQTACLVGTFALLGVGSAVPDWAIIVLSGLGAAFCVIWLQVIRMSNYYQKVFLCDAQRAAIQENAVGTFYCSLGFDRVGQYAHLRPGDFYFRRPQGWRPVLCMSVVTMLFGAAWVVCAGVAITT